MATLNYQKLQNKFLTRCEFILEKGKKETLNTPEERNERKLKALENF